MDLCRRQDIVAFLLLFTTVTAATEDDVRVMNAGCCSSVRGARNMDVVGSRCPSSQLDVQCGPQGCCIATNQTTEFTVAESYQPYPCINASDVIEPWLVCDGIVNCPLGDDELYCGRYVCAAAVYEEPSSNIMAPCPSSDTCYRPTESCQSGQRCRNETISTDLCLDPCPATCLCDVLAMICFEDIEQSTEEEPLIHPRILQLALVDFTGDLIFTNSSSSFSDGFNLDLNPSEISYITYLVIVSPDPLDAPTHFYLEIEDGAFSSNSFLHTLILVRGTLAVITNATFIGLSSLEYLNLDENFIREISANSFAPLKELTTLSLAYNDLTVIAAGAFDGLEKLRSLTLDDNYIYTIEPGAFYPLIQLRILFITDVNDVEDFSVENFEGLEGLQSMHVTDFRLCCRVANLGQCVDYEPLRFSSCSGLLEYQALGAFMWILGACAFFGNAFVLVKRLRSRDDEKKRRRKTAQIQSVLIMNLATADLLTGLYMLILAAADTAFGGDYFIYASSWREGIPCKFVGILGVLSGEASVLILALISIDRLLVIVFPFGPVHLSRSSVRVWAAVIWIFSGIISILPPIITSALSKNAAEYFYIYSDVCLGLPLIRSTSLELNVERYDYITQDIDYTFEYTVDGKYAYYAIVVFIGLNLLCFLIILFSYVTIFIYARRISRKARRSAERDQELRLAARMALIVGTDFCCWMPIIILGILTQTGAVTVSTEMYAWSVVFIIPINSAVNPFLYTFGETCTKRGGVRASTGSTPLASRSDEASKGANSSSS